MMQDWLIRSAVVLRGGGLDESPHCYKRLPEVLAAHGDSIRVLHTLTPVGVAMAGANEFDPLQGLSPSRVAKNSRMSANNHPASNNFRATALLQLAEQWP